MTSSTTEHDTDHGREREGRPGEAGACDDAPPSTGNRQRRSRNWLLRRALLALWDVTAWTLAIVVAAVLRYEFEVADVPLRGVLAFALVTAVVQLSVGGLLGVYSGRDAVGSVEDAINLASAMGTTGALVFTLNVVVDDPPVPRSVPVVATLIALSLAFSARMTLRRQRERRARPDRRSAQRVIVFGAGPEGRQLVRSMLADGTCGYLPVALLHDDPELHLRRFLGVSVRGTRTELARTAAETDAQLLVIATRDLDGPAVREIVLAASGAGLGVKVMPPLTEALRPWFRLSDLEDLDISSLLGRTPVDIDLVAIAGYVTGRRVLVTGAGGSIGSELCRQLHRFAPAELLMLDRDESALHATQLSIYGKALLDTDDVILADIRGAATLQEIFLDRRPEVVFHAAALKHLPLLEQFPDEAWKTNVVGTQNVIDAAELAGVDRFVNVSTDKAANPTSVLGRSKRVGELLAAHVAGDSTGTYLSVRFGNVLGSRGSVLTTFAEQIANGAPVTVTHPDVTRFFMTIPEAVQLVIYAGAIGRPGEVLILDMGAPVRIADVARQLMGVVGRQAGIVYTGLRDGEKLHEELLGDGEVDTRPVHPAISHVSVPTLDPADAVERGRTLGAAEAMVELTAKAAVQTASVPRPRTLAIVAAPGVARRSTP